MSKFIGELVLAPNHTQRLARVHESFKYASDILGFILVIPTNFITDGASVPRIFWNIIPPWGAYGRAAIVHDYLYRWQQTPKEIADMVLLEGMWIERCTFAEYAAIYLAVHWFGQRAWDGDKLKPLSDNEALPNAGLAYSPVTFDAYGFPIEK